jgi:hypothetical protein
MEDEGATEKYQIPIGVMKAAQGGWKQADSRDSWHADLDELQARGTTTVEGWMCAGCRDWTECGGRDCKQLYRIIPWEMATRDAWAGGQGNGRQLVNRPMPEREITAAESNAMDWKGDPTRWCTSCRQAASPAASANGPARRAADYDCPCGAKCYAHDLRENRAKRSSSSMCARKVRAKPLERREALFALSDAEREYANEHWLAEAELNLAAAAAAAPVQLRVEDRRVCRDCRARLQTLLKTATRSRATAGCNTPANQQQRSNRRRGDQAAPIMAAQREAREEEVRAPRKTYAELEGMVKQLKARLKRGDFEENPSGKRQKRGNAGLQFQDAHKSTQQRRAEKAALAVREIFQEEQLSLKARRMLAEYLDMGELVTTVPPSAAERAEHITAEALRRAANLKQARAAPPPPPPSSGRPGAAAG